MSDNTRLPHSLEAEEHLLAVCMLDGADMLPKCRAAGITPDSFYDLKHSTIFKCIAELHERGEPTEASCVAEALKAAQVLDNVGGIPFLAQIGASVPTTAQAKYFIGLVAEHAARRAGVRMALEAAEQFQVIDEAPAEIASRFRARLDGMGAAPFGSVIADLAPRRAGFGRTVTAQEPTFLLAGTAIFTRGNISMITAQKKEGKSAACGALLGAVIGGPGCTGDTLKFSANNAAGHAVIHLDTEPAPEDHERLFSIALRRAGHSTPPSWLHSYGVKGLSVAELHRTLLRLLAEAKKLHGGIHSVILDGSADFVADPNDPKECNPFVTQLEAYATDFNCAVICVLHLNPVTGGNGGITKSRGHLGSQLERKCETDLRLIKDADGSTVMFTACARRAPILEKDGPRFSWETSAGMHTSLSETKGTAREAELSDAAREFADDVFSDRGGMRYGELIEAIKSTAKCGARTAERKVTEMKNRGAIKRFPPNLWAKAS